MNKYLAVAVVVLVIALGVAGYLFVHQQHPVGATPGGDFLNQVRFVAGSVFSTQLATTTVGSATLSANEFSGWANSSVVSLTEGLPTGTLTLPASSTIPFIVPNAGDRQTFCVRNATTTAGVLLTLAGGSGTNLLVASSSATALGGTKLLTGKVGCLTLVREAKTSTTYDIDALLTVFQ